MTSFYDNYWYMIIWPFVRIMLISIMHGVYIGRKVTSKTDNEMWEDGMVAGDEHLRLYNYLNKSITEGKIRYVG